MKNLFLACVIGIIGLLIAEGDTKQVKSDSNVPATVDDTGSPAVGSPAEFGAPENGDPIWRNAVFNVRQRNGYVTYAGTAVSLGSGLLVTASHVVEGRSTPEVEVNGQWIPAGFSRVANQDVAYLTINNTSLPSVETRKPEYGENAYAFGLRTQKAMCGRISDDDALALEVGEAGVDQGDSGGGVFGEDGKLLGTIRSHRQNNRRVVMFTVLNPPVPYATKNSYQSSVPQSQSNPAATPSGPPVCSGGQCMSPATTFQTPYRIFKKAKLK